jgi:hypothetical protein
MEIKPNVKISIFGTVSYSVKNIKKIAFIKIDKYEENKVHET